MSKKVDAQITCPKCRGTFNTSLHRSLWLEDSANLELVKNDQLNVRECPHCKSILPLQFPCLLVNTKKEYAVWYEPYPDEQIDKDAELYAQHMGRNSYYAKAERI